ncbi:MAG TPA: hypothetical protein VFK44_05230 [Bacillales bacterium]|nr:hypothetical protein [Bacillales bacterium]
MEYLLWSLALPGFGQLLRRQYVKGILLLVLEFMINVRANFNEVILLSFQGRITEAIARTDYEWLMFYPCFYMFAAWDAYRYEAKTPSRLTYLPFVFGAFFVTVGLIYSNVRVFGILWGPLWLPLLSLVPGVTVGWCLKVIFTNRKG